MTSHKFLVLFLFIIACKQTGQDEKPFIVGQEWSKTDEKMQKIEERNNMNIVLVKFYRDVKNNLILCDNFKFTIRIDRLTDNSLRYACWKKPKSTIDLPDLIIQDGIVLNNVAADRWEYSFPQDEWIYSIEKIVSGDSQDIVHIFLEIRDKEGKENYAWKMRDLTNTKFIAVK